MGILLSIVNESFDLWVLVILFSRFNFIFFFRNVRLSVNLIILDLLDYGKLSSFDQTKITKFPGVSLFDETPP